MTGGPATAGAAGRTAARTARRMAGDPASGTPTAPVVVLTYAGAGASRLRAVFADPGEMACSSGTGLLPLCETALATWRQAEGGRTSSLAVASVRRLATGMINAMLVRSGRRRWCETAIAQADNARAFRNVFPEARFVCLHRSAPDMIYAMLRGTPWGPTGTAFAPYVAAHPGSPVAAMAAYWTAHAGPLLEFERAFPKSCLRVRYEDLVGRRGEVSGELAGFLGVPLPRGGAGDGPPAPSGPDAPGCGADVPASDLTAPLRAEVDRLHAALGYPPLPDD
ncbi:MAG TPA: sulfotransferase [Streptosporangiaceae bacterium]|jgi:hypothetical protein